MRAIPLTTAALLLAFLSPPALDAVSYYEGWDVPDDPAGWVANTVGTTVDVINSGGNLGGYLRSFRTDSDLAVGGTTELADASGSYANVNQVSFDVRFISGDFVSAAFRVRYHDSTYNGWNFALAPGPGDAWQSYTIPIDPTWDDAEAMVAGWAQEGAAPSFAVTMSDVYHPEVRMSGVGPLDAGIDNFRIQTSACDQTQILSANFNSDTVWSPPDLTLPGGPVGDYLQLNLATGTVIVQNSFGTLTDKPVVMGQHPGIGGLDMIAYVNDTPQCNQVTFSWRSLAEGADVEFMAMAIRDASNLILASVEYRPDGVLTYNSAGYVGPALPVPYIPAVDQLFAITIDPMDHTSSLSIDGVPVAGFQDVPYAEDGAGNPTHLGFEGGGTSGQVFAIDDISASTCSCGGCDDEADPPEMTITLDRDTLWPPNHKMAQVCATVTAIDACDPNPTIALVSVTSDEPDDGRGDGETGDDIEIVPGDPPTCFNLRSERQGGSDGRTYTIVYSATDALGNAVLDTVTVNVPHDQSGDAMAAAGFSPSGAGLMMGVSECALVIPGTHDLRAESIASEHASIGSEVGVVRPARSTVVDVNGDRFNDLVLFYEARAILELKQATDDQNAAAFQTPLEDGALNRKVTDSTLGLRYMVSGIGYLVSDIFQLERAKLPGSGSGDRPLPELLGLNVESASTGIVFSMPQSGSVQIDIFNVLGRKVRTLVDRNMTSGVHSFAWDRRDDSGSRVSQGMYFARILAPGRAETRKIAVITR